MDIVPVRVNVCLSESEDSEGEMAYKEAQIQGDYSGYVPPEVVVTDTATVSPRRASAPVTKPSQKGGPVRPESPTEVPVQVRGNLQKMGKRLKGWHTRYFEIQGSHMYYYKNHTKKDCLGEINLTKCFFCDATSAATFGHAFELRTTERSHFLAARSKDEMVQWVRVIRKNKGGTEQAVAKKPKRWESFKHALAIQPRRPASKPEIAPKKKNRKSKVNKLRISPSKDRSPSPTPSQGDAHTPLTQHTHTEAHSSRPMSLTEHDFEQDTLDILASFQPSRSLPATPLTAKRPINFNESPCDSPTFSRKSIDSPALTIDSKLSTPSHSVTTSPAHSPAKNVVEETEGTPQVGEVEGKTPKEEIPETDVKTEEKEIDVIVKTKEGPVEIQPDIRIEVPVIAIAESSISEDDLLNTEDQSEDVTKPTMEISNPECSVPVESPPGPVLDFMTKKYTWDEIRDVLDFNEDNEVRDYSMLPPEDPVWLKKPTSVEQLRVFLLSCP